MDGLSERTCAGYCCLVMQFPGTIEDAAQAEQRNPMAVRDGLVLLRTEGDTSVVSCSYHDPVTQLCTIYEQRPDRCRDFPNADEPCYLCGLHAPEGVVPL